MTEVRSFEFSKQKYGDVLLIDCKRFSETQEFILTDQPFTVSFYEIYFITNSSAVLYLDNEEIPVEKGTIIFLPPHKIRRWKNTTNKIEGYFIIFEREFIETFFQDTLFLYRFHFFHNSGTPSFITLQTNQIDKIVKVLDEIRFEIGSLKSDSHHLLRSLF